MTTTEILTGIKNWVVGKLSLKQNVISDLADIRSGAQAGATSVQPADILSYFDNAVYDSGTHRINFYHGQSVIAYIDASPFIVDGMIDDVRIENGYLVIDFNSASGKQDISIPLTDIFNPNNYYNKTQTDGLLAQKQDVIQDIATIRSGASAGATAVQPEGMSEAIDEVVQGLENGNVVPQYAKTLEDWADQKAIATPDTYTDAVRTTGGDIPVETSAGSKLESIKPMAGSKWTAKMLFNGSYNMLNAAKWGTTNSQPYVGGVGSDFVYFLVPELTLGTFGTADENNGLLFTDSDGENVQPTSIYFKPLGTTFPQSLTDGTFVTPTNVSYDGKTYKDYETSGAGWLIIPKSYYDNDICAHIAWEDWYDKHVSLNEPTTNPEAVVGTLMLEGLLALAHSDKYLRGVNDGVCDYVEFGETSATITHMVDELSVDAASWTNSATGESDSQGNGLYRHSATVSGIKNGGAACVEGEDGGIPLTVNGTTVSYIDTSATASASVVFYEVTATSTTKAYTDSIFNGSNINQETGVLPINDCSIEAQVAMDGNANITVKYAKNIVDQVAINATVDVPQIKHEVEEHEERITDLEDTAVRTCSYDASVAVGLADNFKGDTIVDAEFYKRKTGGTQSVGSGIAAIKEVRGKSIVWNQLVYAWRLRPQGTTSIEINGITWTKLEDGSIMANGTASSRSNFEIFNDSTVNGFKGVNGHKYFCHTVKGGSTQTYYGTFISNGSGIQGTEEKFISTCIDETKGCGIILRVENGKTVDNVRFTPMLIDLTLMFGAGNEPATAEEIEKMFPFEYYDYNAGEVIPFAGQNLVTTGFNQWDEEWEVGIYDHQTGEKQSYSVAIRCKNFIKVIPEASYYFESPTLSSTIAIYYYDANGNFIRYISLTANTIFTVTDNTFYIAFNMPGVYGTTYNNDICINISNQDKNGTYEPYEKHTLPLDPSQWRDEQGNLVFPYGGMHGVGTVYDYAKVDADGYIRKAVRCFSSVDLGSLAWMLNNPGASLYCMCSEIISNMKAPRTLSEIPNIVCRFYVANDFITTVNDGKDKVVGIRVNESKLEINDRNYTNAATFKSAMNGVMLYYELIEPVEVELATPVYAKYLVDKDGTEEITPTNGATPYTTMANISILYAMDARGEIKNLPKNYLSKESAENMLNAMVSAGVIASYIMTWDAANGRYAFVITAPVQPQESNE